MRMFIILRSKKEYTANIIEGLKWLGLKWEPEIQIQSKRIRLDKY